MVMENGRRLWAVFFLVIAILGLLFLSSGLPGIALSSEWGLGDFGSGEARRASDLSAGGLLDRLPALSVSLLRLVFMSTILLVPTALFFALFSAEIRKALIDELKKTLPFVLWLITLLYLLQRLRLNMRLAPADSSPGESVTPPDWISNPTALVAFFVGFLMLLLLSGAAWFVWRRTRPGKLEQIAIQAQQTLDHLEAGGSFKNAIVKCYYQMCLLLSEKKRIERDRSMTPREFAACLRKLGVGGAEAQRLTALFEKVRYGAYRPGQGEEREAIACLMALARVAQEPQEALTAERYTYISKENE